MTVNGDDLKQTRCELLRQGDIIRIHPGPSGESVGLVGTCVKVAILSQTRDIVQTTKRYCLVAPAEQTSEDSSVFIDAFKGRRPLRIPLRDESGQRWVADAERAFSIQKTDILSLVVHCSHDDQGESAGIIRARIARVFGRFPFPDEVQPVFKRLQDRLRSKAGGSGNLGQVIDLVSEIRVSSDQWDSPGRRLKLFLILSSEILIPNEDADPAWVWNRTKGWRDKDSETSLSLDRTCELILENSGGDATTELNLWQKFGECLYSQLVMPCLNDEVTAVNIEVVSDEDFTLRQFRHSESLDLETLSDSYDEDDGSLS